MLENSLFHVKQVLEKFNITKFHEILFYILVFCLPIQTRTLFNPETAYVSWSFNYHLGIFLYFTDILLITCLVSWLITTKIAWKQLIKDYWTLFLLLLAILFSLFHVKHIEIGLYQALKYIEILGFTLYVSQIITKKQQYKLILGIIAISGTFQALLAILQFQFQHSLNLSWLGEYIAPIGTSGLSNFIVNGEHITRSYGTFSHPNVLAGFLIVSLISSLYLISTCETKIRKFIFGLLSIIIIFGLFYTFSRITWILTLISLIFYLLFHVKQIISAKKLSLPFLIIFLITVVSCGTLFITQKNLLFTRSFDSDGQISLNSRVFYNNLALDSVKNTYLTGLGIGNYIPKLQDMFHVNQPEKQMQPWQYQPPHNIFLLTLVELGTLGLIALCLMFAQALSFAWNLKNTDLGKTLLLIFSVLIIIGLFDHYLLTIQQGRLLLFLIIGMLMATKNLKLEF
jgi:O-antigen ligase